MNNRECQAQREALERAVEQGILTAEERDSVMSAVSSSYSGGIAYDPFDVLQHVLEHPRYPAVRALYERPQPR